MVWLDHSDSGLRLQKKRALGSLQKNFFQPLNKCCFLAGFEKRQKTPVSINKDRCLVKPAFFIFVPKQVKNRLKKNIVSNLPWITDFNFRGGRMEASMKTEDRRLRIEDGGNGEKALALGAALCRVLLAWDRRGKAQSPQHRISGPQSKLETLGTRLGRVFRTRD